MPDTSPVDNLLIDDIQAVTPMPGLAAGVKLKHFGQTANAVSGNVSHQGIGSVALPALAAGAVGTVTIMDNLISVTSIVFPSVGRGTTTAGAGAEACIVLSKRTPSSGSLVLDVRNVGTAATLSTDYILHYWCIN